MDLPSDSDESDVDFVPEGGDSDAESEAEADRETGELYEKELTNKRKMKEAKASSGKKTRKKLKTSDTDEDKPSKVSATETKELDPEKLKKYEDDLWASFLDKPAQSNVTNKLESTSNASDKLVKLDDSKDNKEESKSVIKPACDPVVLDKPVAEDIAKSKVISDIKGKITIPPCLPGPRKSGGGLASVLNKIGKKDKVSTLEKSKSDWMSFKRDEGIDEEIQTHNRGRDGFLERQDFLQRTDVRQFEIEKSLRQNKKSNR